MCIELSSYCTRGTQPKVKDFHQAKEPGQTQNWAPRIAPEPPIHSLTNITAAFSLRPFHTPLPKIIFPEQCFLSHLCLIQESTMAPCSHKTVNSLMCQSTTHLHLTLPNTFIPVSVLPAQDMCTVGSLFPYQPLP